MCGKRAMSEIAHEALGSYIEIPSVKGSVTVTS